MTKDDIEAVFDRVRSWPEALQKQALSALLEIEQAGDPDAEYELTEEDLAAIDAADAAAARGEFATEEEIRRVFRRDR